MEFAQQVNAAVKDPTAAAKFSADVLEYAKAVRAAATDLGNRVKRSQVLDRLVAPIFASEQANAPIPSAIGLLGNEDLATEEEPENEDNP